MLDCYRSFSGRGSDTTQRQRQEAGSTSGGSDSSSEYTNSNPGSTVRMLKPAKGEGGRSSSSGGGSGGSGGSISGSGSKLRSAMGACASSSGSTRIHLPSVADDRLRAAAERFLTFRSKLRALDVALRRHHEDVVRVRSSRAAATAALSDAGRGTPLHDLLVGRAADLTDETAEAHDGEVRPYAALHNDVAISNGAYVDQYREETLVYVAEWEKTISTRIATELRHVRRLHSNFVKYHRKVESLRSKAAARKGGPTESELAKIDRNESKLRTATKDYRRNLVAVTLLTEEVTDRGWKDLIPLALMLIEYDVETSARTAEIAAKLNDVREETKALGRRYEMDYAGMTAGRLRILLEEDATEFVSPGDMADIESIQPSVGTGSSVGTPVSVPYRQMGGIGGGASRFGASGAVIPPAIRENPAEDQYPEGGAGASSPRSDGKITPPCSDGAGSEESSEDDDDDLSLERPEPEGASPPRHQPKSPSAPPVDLMTAASRGEDAARREAELRRAPQPRPQLQPQLQQQRQPPPAQAPQRTQEHQPPQLPRVLPQDGRRGQQPPPPDPDDDGSKINYPTSIYFAEADFNGQDDVTALTPYPDLVSI